MKTIYRLLTLLLLGLLTMLMVVACNSGGVSNSSQAPSGNAGQTEPIKVGSKDFTEEFILGEMYALMLENSGFEVERKLNLGGTPVAHAGLQSGEIDLYPEYTGTALLTVLKLPVKAIASKFMTL